MLRAFLVFGLVVAVAAGLAANPAFAETPVEVLAALKSRGIGHAGFSGILGRSAGRVSSRPSTTMI